MTGAVDSMSTTIVFDGAHVPVRETAATATLGHFATSRLGWALTAGGIVAGSIEGRDIHGGATIGASVSYLAVLERARQPFVGVSATFGTALLRGTADDGRTRSWSAWDVRGGVIAGKTLGRFVPYLATRVFGGPVFWHRAGGAVTGGDRYHVTAGVGLILRLPGRIDVTLEGMPLGEQSATAGVSLRF
ncbi:hypothetical protein BH11MYX1_BH11MYX1_02290 [soil metagenome]